MRHLSYFSYHTLSIRRPAVKFGKRWLPQGSRQPTAPSSAVDHALSKRAKKYGDVLRVGGGKWGLKAWYTENELDDISKSMGGMGGRDKAQHGERTKKERCP